MATEPERQRRYAAIEGGHCVDNIRRALAAESDVHMLLHSRLAEVFARAAIAYWRQSLRANAADRAWLAAMDGRPQAADRAYEPVEPIVFHAHEGTCRYCGHVVKMLRNDRTMEPEPDNCRCLFCAQSYMVDTPDLEEWERRQWLEKLVGEAQADGDY